MHKTVGLLARLRDRDSLAGGEGDGRRGRKKGAENGVAPRPLPLALLGWSPRDAVGFAVGTVAVLAIVVNVLYLQAGSHPAPLFKPTDTESHAGHSAVKAAAPPSLQRMDAVPAPVIAKPVAPHAARTPGEIITDIQRELARRGYYDGPVDGLYGPRTDGAIRDFERAAGLKPSAQPSETLLQAIMRSPLRSGKGITGSTPAAVATVPRGVAPMTSASAPAAARIVAVQRALSDFGYGQIRPSGTLDADTEHAIAAFERQRNMPVTGRISDQLIRELSSETGRPLD